MTERGRSNSDSHGPFPGLNGNTSPYARLVLYIIDRIGVPAAVLGILLAMGAGWIPSPITATHATVQQIDKTLKAARNADTCTMKLLVAICRNTARTDRDVATCNRLSENAIGSSFDTAETREER